MSLALANTPRDKGRALSRLREEAAEAERRGQPARAIELLEEAVQQAPDDQCLRRLAGLLERAGRVQDANSCYRQLAEGYEHSHHLARAIAAWKRVAQNEPGFAGAHVKLGELYTTRGLRADARKHYQSALTIYRGTGRMREAQQIEQRVAEIDELSNPSLRVTAPPPYGPDTATEDGRAVPPTAEVIPGGESSGGEDALSRHDVEFVRERLDQARLFRRYALHDQARDQLTALLARDPGHAPARRELIGLLQEAGQAKEAAEQQRVLDELEGSRGKAPCARPSPGGEPAGARAAAAAPAPSSPRAGEEEGPEADLGDLVGLSGVLEAAVEGEEQAPGGGEDSALEDLELVPMDELEADVAGQHLPIELDDFSHTLREFRAQVNERLGDDDVETRYDLGIAYREMGLLAEAIAELQLASRSERRLVECVSLLAACFVDKGLPRLAVQWLERGLAAPGLGAPQAMSLRYDLAAVLAASGEGERARDLFTEIYGEDAGFRDVAERLRALRAGGSEDEGRGVVLPWRKR